jgi:hypothetical protein
MWRGFQWLPLRYFNPFRYTAVVLDFCAKSLVPSFLRIVELIMLALVTGVIVSVVWVLGYYMLHGPEDSPRMLRMARVLALVDEHWKVGLLLLIPLFYRTVRAFLERVEEAWGVKAPRRIDPVETTPAKPNPPEPLP